MGLTGGVVPNRKQDIPAAKKVYTHNMNMGQLLRLTHLI
jgi:hypothetical protein